jgi:hypothetical protein
MELPASGDLMQVALGLNRLAILPGPVLCEGWLYTLLISLS